MATFRIVYNEKDITSDFIGECQCPSCGDEDRRADYGETCRFCGHNVYQPCLEVVTDFFSLSNGFTAENIRNINALDIGEECQDFSSNIVSVIRIED